jgi:formylglycine-generating enzyme required for sulfatase activity
MMKTCGLMLLVFGMVLAAGRWDRFESAARAQAVSPGGTSGVAELTLDLGHGVQMRLVPVPAGTFTMGSPATVADRDGEDPHEVTFSRPFYMGVYDVTVDQYAQFVKETGQYHGEPNFKQSGHDPVVNVTWDDARAFCKWLSEKTGKAVALPTEAQWEYACRAGSTTRYYYGDDPAQLGQYAWFSANNSNSTHPVGQKKPNAWGLYDMHGNVWQWCSDYFERGDKTEAVTDPAGPGSLDKEKNAARVLRGGSYRSAPGGCRSARRGYFLSSGLDECFGFRVVVLQVPGAE